MAGGEKNFMGIIDAINSIDIQAAAWAFMLIVGWWLYKGKNKK